jgi:hypothetical protein
VPDDLEPGQGRVVKRWKQTTDDLSELLPGDIAIAYKHLNKICDSHKEHKLAVALVVFVMEPDPASHPEITPVEDGIEAIQILALWGARVTEHGRAGIVRDFLMPEFVRQQ